MKSEKLQFLLCHRIPERSFFYKGKQFPVCARCTGIHVGYFSIFLFILGFISITWWVSLLMVFPTYVDGVLQARTDYKSNNFLRFSTGLLAGIGFMSIASILGIALGKLMVMVF